MRSTHLMAVFAFASVVLPACGGTAPQNADAGAIGGSGGGSSSGDGGGQISLAGSGGNSGGIAGGAGGSSNAGGTSASTGPAPITGLSLFFSDLTSVPMAAASPARAPTSRSSATDSGTRKARPR